MSLPKSRLAVVLDMTKVTAEVLGFNLTVTSLLNPSEVGVMAGSTALVAE